MARSTHRCFGCSKLPLLGSQASNVRKMQNKMWIASGEIILVGLRDYQDRKVDVIFKYQVDEARLWKAYGELAENVRLNNGVACGLDNEEEGSGVDAVEFEDIDSI